MIIKMIDILWICIYIKNSSIKSRWIFKISILILLFVFYKSIFCWTVLLKRVTRHLLDLSSEECTGCVCLHLFSGLGSTAHNYLQDSNAHNYLNESKAQNLLSAIIKFERCLISVPSWFFPRKRYERTIFLCQCLKLNYQKNEENSSLPTKHITNTRKWFL